MDNEVITHTDYDWNSRINSLVNYLVYDQPIPEGTNRYELEAAKLVLRWDPREPESGPQNNPTVTMKAVVIDNK